MAKRIVVKTIRAVAALLVVFWTFILPAKAITVPSNFSYTEQNIVDSDEDGLSDSDEVELYATDPLNADTDGDGFNDGIELMNGYSPHNQGHILLSDVDTDSDYLIDSWELALGTGLGNPDSDGDLFLDGTEVAASYDPLNPEPVVLEKLISVSTAELSLTYSMGGKVLETVPVSTGKSWTPTPTGEFSVLEKVPVKTYAGPTWNYPNTEWNLRFTFWRGWNYYIHSAYWHDKFGREPVSGGCVNVRIEDMERLYWWAQVGTRIAIE